MTIPVSHFSFLMAYERTGVGTGSPNKNTRQKPAERVFAASSANSREYFLVSYPITILLECLRTALQIFRIQKLLIPFVPDRILERRPPVPNSASTEKRSTNSALKASWFKHSNDFKSSFIQPDETSSHLSYCRFRCSYSGNAVTPLIKNHHVKRLYHEGRQYKDR